MKKLNKIQWVILDLLLIDDDEPFEAIDGEAKKTNPKITPDKVLSELFELYKKGFVVFKQMPIAALGQKFPEKEIIPKSEKEILGDMREYYAQYCEKRDYLWKYSLEKNKTEQTGLPFGIWVTITKEGKEEANKQEYDNYCKNK